MPTDVQWRRELPWCGAIALLTATIHAGILRLSWMYDDGFHIHFLLTHPLRFLVTPSLWRELPFKMYTPLQFVSYALDLHAFGLTPRAWYAHQLVSLALAGSALYLVLRLWWSRAVSAAGGALFALDPHIAGWAGILMARHYIEGFLFACLAVYAWVLFLLGGKRLHLAGALAAYALAILCKEVYFLLPAILLALPESKPRRTLVSFTPVALAYLIARYLMLGTFAGGYGWAVPPSMRLSFYAAAPWRIVAEAFRPALLAIPIIAAVILIAARRPLLLIPLFAALAAFVLPVVPVSTEIAARYVMLPALIGSLAALMSVFLLDERYRGAVLAIFIGWVLAAAWAGNRVELQSQHKQSQESRFFLQLGPRDVLSHPVIPPASIAELDWLKTHPLHGAAGAQWYFDDIYACSHDLARNVVWAHDRGTFAVIPAPDARKLPCNGDSHPLMIDMFHEGDAIYWHLAPYETGTYDIILGEGLQAFTIPPAFGFHLGDMRSLAFRIRYSSPSGWKSYTPVLDFDFSKGVFTWRRADERRIAPH